MPPPLASHDWRKVVEDEKQQTDHTILVLCNVGRRSWFPTISIQYLADMAHTLFSFRVYLGIPKEQKMGEALGTRLVKLSCFKLSK